MSIAKAIEAYRRGDFEAAKSILLSPPMKENLTHKGFQILAMIALNESDLSEALAFCIKALEQYDGDPELYALHGVLLRRLEREQEAFEVYDVALKKFPDNPFLWVNQGNLAHQAARLSLALSSYQQALALCPQLSDVWISVGIIQREMGRFAESAEAFKRATQMTAAGQTGERAYYELALTYYEQGDMTAVSDVYSRLGEMLTIPPWRAFCRDTLFPIIPESHAELERALAKSWKAVQLAEAQAPLDLPVEDLAYTAAEPSFYRPYAGDDELAFRTGYGQLVYKALKNQCPQMLDFESVKPNGKPHLGVFVSRKHLGVFQILLAGLLKRLPPEAWNVTVFTQQAGLPRLSAILAGSTLSCEGLPDDVLSAASAMRRHGLSILYYFEVGTDSTNYFLPFFRSAPVQMTSWGFPVTSGIPTMDYFISSQHLEVPEAQAHYSESLMTLPTLPVYFERPILTSTNLLSRDALGWKSQDVMLVCPQSLFKIHPDMDKLFSRILSHNHNIKILLVNDLFAVHSGSLEIRLAKTLSPGQRERVVFLPRLDQKTLWSVMHQSTAMLDTLHFGGGMTTYEALALGVPIVTCPSPYMRSRVTLGCYRQMGEMHFQGLVASNTDEYVDHVLRLTESRDYRHVVSQSILTHNECLFNQAEAVKDFESLLLELLETPQKHEDKTAVMSEMPR